MLIFHLHDEGCSDYDLLSQREKEVLKNIEAEKNYKEIASCLTLSPHTVRTHIRNIYKKLQVSTRSEAIGTAISKGII